MATATPRRSKLAKTRTESKEVRTGATFKLTPLEALALSALVGQCEDPKPGTAAGFARNIRDALAQAGYDSTKYADQLVSVSGGGKIAFLPDSEKFIRETAATRFPQ